MQKNKKGSNNKFYCAGYSVPDKPLTDIWGESDFHKLVGFSCGLFFKQKFEVRKGYES